MERSSNWTRPGLALALGLIAVLGGVGLTHGPTSAAQAVLTCAVSENADGPWSDTCVGESICICPSGSRACPEGWGSCGSTGRTYTIEVQGARIPERKSDGSCWDSPMCALPDAFVEVRVNGTLVATTPRIDDTLTPTWNASFPNIVVPAGASVTFRVREFDAWSDHDGVFDCESMASAARMRARRFGCSGALGSLSASIFPQ
jgi:hypothetical protein